MNIRQLEYFIAVAEERNFSRAAERLHMSQPPLSQQIKLLEDTLDVRLFDRSRQGAKLTLAGEVLLVQAKAIVSDCTRIEQVVRRAAEGLEGYIRIGIINSLLHGILPTALRRFRELRPNIEWSLLELLPDKQEQALLNGDIDIGFSCNRTSYGDLTSVLAYPQQLVAASPRSHALASKMVIGINDLKSENLIMLDARSPLTREILATCRKSGFNARIVHTSTDPTVVLSLVGAGLGMSVLPANMQGFYRDQVTFIPFEADGLNANVYATMSRDADLTVAERFLSQVTSLVINA
ncbi:LysR family transcriptional regulator [Ochrobactrum sp. CM-21-5]|nr:LysR substrate-binding domain-containing protein [Ochrobactrum sp. CM-21-5]MBC2887439.1 LysR family transcriptional regulator [Ochrobactrum sp. CM-21-5]